MADNPYMLATQTVTACNFVAWVTVTYTYCYCYAEHSADLLYTFQTYNLLMPLCGHGTFNPTGLITRGAARKGAKFNSTQGELRRP